MKRVLWLDDIRKPKYINTKDIDDIPPFQTVWVKNYQQFVDWISREGLPDIICFDHDLGDEDEKTGYDAAKWLVNYCMDRELSLPLWEIQSANPVGKENINGLLNNFLKWKRNEMDRVDQSIADRILKKYEDDREYHFHDLDRQWLIEAMLEFHMEMMEIRKKIIW